jgi:hypothetical protein
MMFLRTFILPILALAALHAPAAQAQQNGAAVQIQINQQGGGQSITVIQQGGGQPITIVNGQQVSPAPAPPTPAASAAPAAPARPAVPIDQLKLPALVAALGGENWPARQQAEDQLTAAGPDVLARLDPLLAQAADAEILWRLERIYHALTPPDRYAVAGQPAFLGIGFSMVSAGNDARLTDRQWGVQVNLVQPGTPAEQAGLAVDDLIVTLNGEPFVGSFTDGAANQSVTQRIQSYGVGAEVKLVFFRAQERRETTVKLVLRTDGQPESLTPAQKWKRYWNKHLADLRAAIKK